MTNTIDQYVGENMSSHAAAHGSHGSKLKKKHEDIEAEHQEVFDEIVNDAFDETWHRETTQTHNDAYITAMGTLKGKKFTDRPEAEEALIDAIIKYRTASGVPVSSDSKHRHYLHQELKQVIERIEKDSQGKVTIDTLIKEGNTYKILEAIHQEELSRNIGSKVGYEIDKRLPHDQDPDFYQGIVRAYGNYTGKFFSKGKQAKYGNRDTLVTLFTQLYEPEVTRRIDEYVKAAPKDDKHGVPHH
ncbi:MAG: hypothetical protein WC254_04425 [Candidatus Woesearchaeota archaeon]|jgi:uncharacterized protein (UPF0335 family)